MPKIYLLFIELNLTVHLIHDQTNLNKRFPKPTEKNINQQATATRAEERGFEERTEKGEV